MVEAAGIEPASMQFPLFHRSNAPSSRRLPQATPLPDAFSRSVASIFSIDRWVPPPPPGVKKSKN